MDTPILSDQQKLAIIISVRTLDDVQMTCQERQPRGMDGEKESEEYVSSAHLFDNDDVLESKFTI